jgi:hypothetical protein
MLLGQSHGTAIDTDSIVIPDQFRGVDQIFVCGIQQRDLNFKQLIVSRVNEFDTYMFKKPMECVIYKALTSPT